MPSCCPPPLAMWPSPIWPVSSCPFTLSYCNCPHLPAVFGPSFLFFALHLDPLQDNVNCDITITATSPSTHTGHTPSLLPPTPSLPPQHRRYFTNPIAVTTTATPPLTLTLTCVAWHKNQPTAVVLTVPGAT